MRDTAVNPAPRKISSRFKIAIIRPIYVYIFPLVIFAVVVCKIINKMNATNDEIKILTFRRVIYQFFMFLKKHTSRPNLIFIGYPQLYRASNPRRFYVSPKIR